MENLIPIIILKCAGCDQKHSIQSTKIIKCELYLCGMGFCHNNPSYAIPERKPLNPSIILGAAGSMYGIQYH